MWKGYLDLSIRMETEFECSGICTQNERFTFTDITSGEPKHECKKLILDSLKSLRIKEYYLAWTVFTNSLVAIFVVSILVCKFPKYNMIVIERRKLVESSALEKSSIIDSTPFLEGLDYTKHFEQYHNQANKKSISFSLSDKQDDAETLKESAHKARSYS